MPIEEIAPVKSVDKNFDHGFILDSTPGAEGHGSSLSVEKDISSTISVIDENLSCADQEGNLNDIAFLSEKYSKTFLKVDGITVKNNLISDECQGLPVNLDKCVDQNKSNDVFVVENNNERLNSANAYIVTNGINLNNNDPQDTGNITGESQEFLDVPVNLCIKNLDETCSSDDYIKVTLGKSKETLKSDLNGQRILYASKVSISQRLKNSVPNGKTVDQIKKKKFFCDACPKRFAFRSSLLHHTRVHTGERPFSCYVCEKRFMDKNTMNRHIRIHVGERNFTCEICDKAFLQKKNLIQHIITHTDDKPFVCEVCQKSFKARRDFNNHVTIHSGEKPFLCELCQKRFHSKMALDKHLRTHSNQNQKSKTFACGVCQRTFANYSSLKDHLSSHTGERPYVCNICQSSYTRKSSLKRHSFQHTEEKPFVCEHCLRVFPSKSSLTQHAQVHNEDKPFVCHVCQKAFRKRYALDSHVAVHSGEKPHICHICQRSFTRKSSLKRHFQTHSDERLGTCVDPQDEKCDIQSHPDSDIQLALATFSGSI